MSAAVAPLDAAIGWSTLDVPTFTLSDNKRPCVEGGFKAATTDRDTLARMHADPRVRFVGIPTGATSGFDVLDIDVAKGGLEWWEANKHRIPVTLIQHTRSGGLHVYFLHALGLRNSASKIAPGVDIRADGGYVVDWRAAGFHCDPHPIAPWPPDLLIEAMRRQHREGNAPAPAELAPPSAADLVALLNAMPNPESTTRDDYVALNLAVQGCLRALDALGQDDANAAEDIRDAAADWSSRWDSGRAADYETELRRWDSDWSIRTNDVSGWRHVLNLADQFGLDTSPWRHAAAVAEFGVLPDESPVPAAAAPAIAPAAATDTAAGDPHWRDKLTINREGPLPSLANVLFILRRAPQWHGVFRLDTFSARLVVWRQPPFAGGGAVPRPAEDADITLAAVWMQDEGLKGVSPGVCADAIAAVARDNRFSPVQDYLNGLHHDGTPRIDTWLIDSLGASDNPLNRAIGAKFLISAVARVLDPGCQVDTMPVLEGPQGLLKSTALRTLFSTPWFTDHIPDLHNKDALLQLQGKWCVEHAEMATLNRTDASRVKEFISRRVDRFRAPFGKLTQDFPRQCVFAATVNPNGTGYLKDETGARRFWPVKCGAHWSGDKRADIALIAETRDQLWAEAVARYRAGESWWLDSAALEDAQAEAADARYDADPWTDAVREFIAGKPFVRLGDVFEVVRIPLPERSRTQQMRLAGVLRALDWHVKQQRIEGVNTRIYVPSAAAARLQPPQHDAPSRELAAIRGDLAALAR